MQKIQVFFFDTVLQIAIPKVCLRKQFSKGLNKKLGTKLINQLQD
jgi:hypothetical protein